MQFLATLKPVEAARHEVSTSVFLEQAALADVNARRTGHQRIGIFDHAVTFGIFKFLVLVAADAVELEDPVIEAGAGRNLARAYCSRQ